ncbi:SDR family oxidoreductase [Ornithinimicrobium avium]|uniref:NmrA/HSCARG family protein n=1 Tax=Ornithinimicrobium avium TaxID=2283195 RepID=A0A345NPA4_9MICO|nr:NmrA family NAD(P)-binding protein [Ornithinimicrobium avium]AXH96862.1 NmrA/HSCARG family protein [Ornithinimicrobium avium]
MPTVTVLGATGKTGRAVVRAALARGLAVRGTSRRHVDDGSGAGWLVADVASGQGLAEAFEGAEAAYLLMPNVHPGETEAMARAARLARGAGVDRLVYHSVADPDDARMPHHLRKGGAEEAVRAVDPGAVVLRPCAYLQNLTGAARAGQLAVPYRLDRPFSLVDLGDVAEVAAAALAGELPAGTTVTLGGPEELTVAQLAARAEQALGRPVAATRTSVQEWVAGPGAQVHGSAREDLLAMFAAYDETGFTADPGPLARLLGRPATTWAQALRLEDR